MGDLAKARAGIKQKGQFYTVNSSYILAGLALPPSQARCVIEPFAGQGDLLAWLAKQGSTKQGSTKQGSTKQGSTKQGSTKQGMAIEAYDIEPKKAGIIQRDTLKDPPNYKDAWILTNPPYLARNKSPQKELFDKYNTNDLYKCFINSLTAQEDCLGGIFIVPVGFFLSPRDIDVRCRNAFLSKYKLGRVNYFEEAVFPDTATTVVAFDFLKAPVLLTEQQVEWVIFPSGAKAVFPMRQTEDWIIGGAIYKLTVPPALKVRRHVEGQVLKKDEQLTAMTLNALDSGNQNGRISLDYKAGYVYPAKECSRSYATLCIQGKTLTAAEQQKLCADFNAFVEEKRQETWSLFLPQYRESKEYARKRIPFELAYTIVRHLLIN